MRYKQRLKSSEKRGALPWPNPVTAGDFREVIDGKQFHPEDEAIKQSAFPLDCSEVATPSQDAKEEPIAQPAPIISTEIVQATTAADALLAAVEQILASMEQPITAVRVAKQLDVSNKQAGKWLKQLEHTGKYRRKNKQGPYEPLVLV